jgi:uncharacterized DUF497 family protein
MLCPLWRLYCNKYVVNFYKICTINVPHPVEDRGIIIGKYQEKLWTAIFTLRGDAIRIISVRRARGKEAKLYEKERDGKNY